MRTNKIHATLALAILLGIGVQTSFAQCNAALFAGGAGTELSPYQISTAQQLQNLNQCLGEIYQNNYVLNNNIDLTTYLASGGAGYNGGEGWQPIGPGFSGKLNGNGHKVSGLWIDRPSDGDVGLFGSSHYNAEFKNIGVEIDNAKGGVRGRMGVGGLVGENHGGTIINSYATGTVTGTDHHVGGLAGFNGGTISNCFATGSVILTGTGNSVGGLIGSNQGGTISNSYATGSVQGNNHVGGLVGANSGTISSSFSTGSVQGNEYVGGLIGGASGAISNSYATGSVTGNIRVGGLAGNNQGAISNSYATGSVTAIWGGGLVGENYSSTSTSSIISNSFYDKQTSGMDGTGNGIGKTTAEMKMQSTYKGWDLGNIWEINPAKNNGYPSLLWQNSEHLASATIAVIPNQIWTGNPITPKPNVIFKGNDLIEGTNFDYSYDNNIQTGTAALKIVGKGSYSGQAKIMEFKIVFATCGTGFAEGTGTEDDPYKITDAKSLDAISNCRYESDVYYELQNDIDLGSYIANTSAGWQPISSFSGKFNGNGHKVSGLWINRPLADGVGLFESMGSFETDFAEIRNIGVEIDDAKGGVRGKDLVGGLVGGNGVGTINNSFATGSVTGGGSVGGLVGHNNGGTISNSFATGSVTGNGNSVGGLAGYIGGAISNSYAIGSVTGGDFMVGGLVGYNDGGAIGNSYYDKETSGMEDTDKGTGKITAEMKTQSTYEGWDFEDTWVIVNSSNYASFNNGYPILQWQLQDILSKYAFVSYIPEQTYNGSEIEPVFTITFNNVALAKGTDYTASYSNNTKAGTAKITIAFIGSYSHLEPIEAYFAITPKPITITGVTADSREYNGTTDVSLSGGMLVGVLNDDVVGFTLGTGTVATPDPDSDKPVTTNIALTGADAGNYTLTQPTDITATITDPTPIFTNRKNPYIGGIVVQATTNAILLSNLPQGAKAEIYNLQGKRIYSAYPENPKILEIGVQTKGVYVVKAGSQSARVAVR